MHGFAAGKPLLSRRTGRRSLPFAASAAGAGSPSGGNYCAARRLLVLVRRGFLSVENTRGSVVFSGLRLFSGPLVFTVRRRRGSVLRKFSPCRSAVRGNAWYVRALKTISSWPRISCQAPPVSPICWRPLRGALPHPLSSFHRVCRVSCWPPPCCRGWSGHTS